MPPQADSATLSRLLDLQAEDTAIKRLAERRACLPEAARLAEITATLDELNADLGIAGRQDDDASREQSRLEGAMELADQKIEREEGRLFSGSVANPKELSALQHEVAMLKRQRAELEESLLEVMVQKEQIAATVDKITAERDAAAGEASSLQSTVGALLVEIDGGAREHSSTRDEIAHSLPGHLLELYDGLRASKGGVAAAALVAGSCQGCHTALPQVEIERLKAEGGLQRCDNCRRILVVT